MYAGERTVDQLPSAWSCASAGSSPPRIRSRTSHCSAASIGMARTRRRLDMGGEQLPRIHPAALLRGPRAGLQHGDGSEVVPPAGGGLLAVVKGALHLPEQEDLLGHRSGPAPHDPRQPPARAENQPPAYDEQRRPVADDALLV